MMDSNKLIENLKSFHEQKYKVAAEVSRDLSISQLDVFTSFYRETEGACQGFFLYFIKILYTFESIISLPEETLREKISILDIQQVLKKFCADDLVNVFKAKEPVEKSLNTNGDFLKKAGCSEYVQHIEAMKDFMGSVIDHLKNAKTDGLDTAKDLKKLKTDEFNSLCTFIENEFNEKVVNQKPSQKDKSSTGNQFSRSV